MDYLINDFAIRSFRETGDYDYIAARAAYRLRLPTQFLWLSHQAIEKYFKCILLLNRIPAKHVKHDLLKSLELIEKNLSFKVSLNETSRKFIKYLNSQAQCRYLDIPFYIMGIEIAQLDMTVWHIRRYCKNIDYEIRLPDDRVIKMLEHELSAIEESEKRPYHLFKVIGGVLENIINDKNHPARRSLVWHNLFFGKRKRNKVTPNTLSYAANSPLYLHPEILDEVLKYVYLPKPVAEEYRKISNKQKA